MKRSKVIRAIKRPFKNMRLPDASAILYIVTDTIIDAVANGDRVEIRGFGTFKPRTHVTKLGYNPSSGRPQIVGPGTTILFKPSRELTKKMNG